MTSPPQLAGSQAAIAMAIGVLVVLSAVCMRRREWPKRFTLLHGRRVGGRHLRWIRFDPVRMDHEGRRAHIARCMARNCRVRPNR